MNVVVVSDIHIDNQTDGRVSGGIPIRVLDTYKSLQKVIDYCRENNVENLLITGDIYAHNRPSMLYKNFFYKFVKEITAMGIHISLIEGNHDKSRNAIGKSSVSEFKKLDVENIYLADEPELLDFADFQVAAIPWQYHSTLPEFNLDKSKKIIAIAHATVWGQDQEKKWESSELKDFEIPIEYFYQFDYTVLGHIHKHIVLNEEPLIMYPGSCERWTFGERDNGGFVHITDDGWKHILYDLRPKYDLFNEIPEQIDPEGMYRLRITEGFADTSELHRIFKNAFWFQLQEIRNRPEREIRIVENTDEMTPTEILGLYFESTGQKFTQELRETWQMITE